MEAKLDLEPEDVIFKKIMRKLINRQKNYGESITHEKIFKATHEYMIKRRVFVYKNYVADAFRDQKRYKALIKSGSYMPSALGLWTFNDHKKVFTNKQTRYPKKLMDVAVDSVIALNSRKKKDE